MDAVPVEHTATGAVDRGCDRGALPRPGSERAARWLTVIAAVDGELDVASFDEHTFVGLQGGEGATRGALPWRQV